MARPIECYEVASPSFRDLSLEEQIECKINDWVARDSQGREFYGRSHDEAMTALTNYNCRAA